jgi:hypothetical protein
MKMTQTPGKCVNAETWTDTVDLAIDFEQGEGKCKGQCFRRGTKEAAT